MNLLAQASDSNTSRNLTIVLFLLFVLATLGITIWASRHTRTATDYYAGGRSFSGFQNGMAIGGDYMSAASFLGIAEESFEFRTRQRMIRRAWNRSLEVGRADRICAPTSSSSVPAPRVCGRPSARRVRGATCSCSRRRRARARRCWPAAGRAAT
jgi:hypothetical protein